MISGIDSDDGCPTMSGDASVEGWITMNVEG
jgi:hypothetical protein